MLAFDFDLQHATKIINGNQRTVEQALQVFVRNIQIDFGPIASGSSAIAIIAMIVIIPIVVMIITAVTAITGTAVAGTAVAGPTAATTAVIIAAIVMAARTAVVRSASGHQDQVGRAGCNWAGVRLS
ncbi:hypothetical protein J2X72_005053 [Phyllobacterium sp. 1468]|uniref:hypothetical protein n=1 Tax=Phyllobacterium sp. 1468 TaxID=2817759 RepID=UPI002865922C|nr:hypothetical protein [Phyllobacterium sp. 1468]MDR6636239.1 hypothetical protein [Phyllobacterium sp. 1468]